MSGKLRLYHFIPATKTEGPGLRAGIWVQGCPHHCHGCVAQDTWDFTAGYSEQVDSLVGRILSVSKLDGITIAGGEPFCQAGSLAELVRKVKAKKPHFTVICFTGWTLDALLKQRSADVGRLLAEVDLLLDGPYVEALASTDRPLVGSSNQEFHFLTPRLLFWKETWGEVNNKLEIRIAPDGRIVANGLIPGDVLIEIVKEIQK
ncbi:4Fe-4S single cluster domain-containing protein [Selenomonas ruminantium]|uniref:4Fe-4S single cluster domain-containing protein n=1 Tax=Selenomonas ruminantium TaxID=971 RepID=UPI00047B2AF8|nr:4Fe-4S single cluster domain-containing protein [Selenomonas ruminantium]